MHLLVGWDALVQSVSQNVLASQEPANASKCVKTLTSIEFECIQAMVNWSTVVSSISENMIHVWSCSFLLTIVLLDIRLVSGMVDHLVLEHLYFKKS